ncbi:MAG: hypothetical protein A3D92_15100 [Bacteroidetes bacterium RIFCSPHIGHO2_02_FULL_44_7]|nr:MAG: hypothetical protein A3D92_15100 [Bacteroidetes bacterium RIFCSPHIGHO2_02_FULL_44_7]
MKKILLPALFSFAFTALYAQQTLIDSIYHGGMYRTYILYVPASYSASTPVPLILNFHGYTSNAGEQLFYGDFRPIADTAGFLVVHPQGTLDANNEPYWNSDWGGAVDDIGFTSALIDSLSAQYSIIQSRVYSTGMSNGGFMSYTLACSLSSRIAAIASVTGTMNYNQSLSCNPQHPMPVMEIHGTADPVVPYNGNGTMSSIVSTLAYWVNTNVCDVTPVQTEVPNTNMVDGCTATHFVYQNGNNGAEVEHFRINLGGHTWPGAPIVVGTTNYDINASKEIWRFFSQYDLYGKITGINETSEKSIQCYPNPTNDVLYFNGDDIDQIQAYTLLDASGKIVGEGTLSEQISIGQLANGFYILELAFTDGKHSLRILKQ